MWNILKYLKDFKVKMEVGNHYLSQGKVIDQYRNRSIVVIWDIRKDNGIPGIMGTNILSVPYIVAGERHVTILSFLGCLSISINQYYVKRKILT